MEASQQTAERKEKIKSVARAELQLAVAQSGYDELGRMDCDNFCKLRDALRMCEFLEALPEEEFAHAEQELRVRKQAFKQEAEEREADFDWRRAEKCEPDELVEEPEEKSSNTTTKKAESTAAKEAIAAIKARVQR